MPSDAIVPRKRVMVDVRYATGPSGRSSPSSWTPSSVGHSRRDHESLVSCPGRVRRATLPRSMTPKTQAPRESLRCFGARTPCRVTVAGAHTHTLNGGLSGAVKDQQRKGETIMDGPAEESVAGCGSRALSTTPPRRVRSGGCRNSRRNCTIVRNSPWSAKASGVVRGHPHTNYPDTKPGPDPSGQASSTRAPGNAHRGPHALELTDPARPDVHTVPPHRSVVSVVLPVVLRMSLQRF
jgi:hypothetical protein